MVTLAIRNNCDQTQPSQFFHCITVSDLNSFRYVEMDGELIKTPCQNFEEVPQTIAITKTIAVVPKITRPPLKMASLKDAKIVIEEGGCTV